MTPDKAGIRKTKKINLESAQLRLRTLCLSDAETIFAYRSLPEVCRYQGHNFNNVKSIIRIIKSTIALKPNTPDSWYQLTITHKQSGVVMGDIGIHFIGNSQAELGYTLAPQYQGRGYATEAVACVIDYLFGTLGKHRITASTDPGNKKSVKLLERIGMRQEACFRKSFWTGKSWADDAIYAILRTEWPKVKKRAV